MSFAGSLAVCSNVTFIAARFAGNETSENLSYIQNITSPMLGNVSFVECGAFCAAGNCYLIKLSFY
jgi:hypothetical protein